MQPQDSFWWRLVHLDPAIYRGLIMALVFALAGFGIRLSDDIPDSLIVLVGAVFALIQALWTKPAVTPNAKVVTYMPDLDKPRGIVSGEANTTASDERILTASRQSGEE